MEVMYTQRKAEWINKAKELFELQERRREYEKLEHETHEELKDLSQGISSKGGGFKFTKGFRKGAIEYSAIPELQGIDLELYRKDSVPVWKLELDSNYFINNR